MLTTQSILTPSLNNKVHDNNATAQNHIDMAIYGLTCPQRQEVESFIINGYKKAFDAKISVTMPYLLAVKKGKLKAVLGIRSANHPLFIEQYLQGPIEQLLRAHNINAKRREIAEIGNLYSNAQRFTVPLF